MSRSRIAFQFSAAALRASNGMVYLWTFTFREVEALRDARKFWSLAAKNLKRRLGFRGLRVFELHPGGHGLHVHVVTDMRFDVNKVRRISQLYRFGRIHVKMIPKSKAGYIAKYLSKQTRALALKGARLWAAFGGQDAHKVSDIIVDTPYTRAYYHLKETFQWFESASFYVRSVLTHTFSHGDMRKFSMFLKSRVYSTI